MRDTPETTKITESGVPSSPSSWFELAEHAERLERERDAWKACAQELAQKLTPFAFYSCPSLETFNELNK